MLPWLRVIATNALPIAYQGEVGSLPIASPWLPGMPLDDEMYPEVLVTLDTEGLPKGRGYRPVRNAFHRYSESYFYYSASTPLDCGEEDFIKNLTARSSRYDSQEKEFNDSLLAFLKFRWNGVRYHYLLYRGTMAGFAITANTTGISHLYYAGIVKQTILSIYFRWQIYLEERRRGAKAFNLGGSEIKSLHVFKTNTFPDHEIQRTAILQYPGSEYLC